MSLKPLGLHSNEDFAFGGLGLTLSQLRTLRACGFTVRELNEEGNWVSPLVEALVNTARMHRLGIEEEAWHEIRDLRRQLND